ncbi:hypothetical protein ABQJ54_04810 [Rhodanobacter sp. Si-c]|uniref:Uncharacterized protein n=1 Tax=Rhodanobacter lycopersici TaxID=3162487 RepID=A0ABV3QC48_9GAMM
MSDTIELLEAIGRDASLRHASVADLTRVLERVQANTSLKAAVALGDSTRLSQEFGGKPTDPPPTQQCPPGEEDEEQEDEGVKLQASAPGYSDGLRQQ